MWLLSQLTQSLQDVGFRGCTTATRWIQQTHQCLPAQYRAARKLKQKQILQSGQSLGHRYGCLSSVIVSTERPLRIGRPYASDAAVDNIQVVDVVEAARNFHQLMPPMHSRRLAQELYNRTKYGLAPTSTSRRWGCSQGVVRDFPRPSIRRRRRRGTVY